MEYGMIFGKMPQYEAISPRSVFLRPACLGALTVTVCRDRRANSPTPREQGVAASPGSPIVNSG